LNALRLSSSRTF